MAAYTSALPPVGRQQEALRKVLNRTMEPVERFDGSESLLQNTSGLCIEACHDAAHHRPPSHRTERDHVEVHRQHEEGRRTHVLHRVGEEPQIGRDPTDSLVVEHPVKPFGEVDVAWSVLAQDAEQRLRMAATEVVSAAPAIDAQRAIKCCQAGGYRLPVALSGPNQADDPLQLPDIRPSDSRNRVWNGFERVQIRQDLAGVDRIQPSGDACPCQGVHLLQGEYAHVTSKRHGRTPVDKRLAGLLETAGDAAARACHMVGLVYSGCHSAVEIDASGIVMPVEVSGGEPPVCQPVVNEG